LKKKLSIKANENNDSNYTLNKYHNLVPGKCEKGLKQRREKRRKRRKKKKEEI
jgi:hypothetical protein